MINQYWEMFKKTGKISDYLKYLKEKENHK